jgi:NAD(P)-dependent dehydrogenase (short-subunit alcohol dehydrogenase family)
MTRVAGKIAIVTGAGSGIGRASAIRLAEEGARVIATDIDAAAGQETVSLIAENAEFYQLDVTDEAQWDALFASVLKTHGRVDVLVNCAGIAFLKPITETSFEEYQNLININVFGTYIGARAAVLAMRSCTKEGEIPKGSIINISSSAGIEGQKYASAYSASKGAVKNMCKTMGVEVGENGEHIRLNSIHPGPVDTKMTRDILGDKYFADEKNFTFLPMKRCSEAIDIAHGVVYLASDESRLVTGSELIIDGGFTAGFSGEG